MRIRIRRSTISFLLAIVVSAAAVAPVPAQDEPLMTLGRAATVYSRVLGEERTLLVALPSGYELTQTRYPVLYLLDGLANFQHATSTVDFLARNGRIPQMIVMGIANTARTRDMTPTHVEDRETSGGGDLFLQFVEDELIPYVDDRFRTQPFRVLFGHSLGGMFAVYTLFTKPDLFGGYVAASPHLRYADGYVVDLVEESLAEGPDLDKSLYVTLGDEPDYVETLDRFVGLLEAAKESGLRWEYVVMENDEHMSTPLKSLYQGLEMIYTGWMFPGDISDADIPSLEAHYRGLSDRFGFEILIPEALLNQLGYLLMAREKYDEAIAAFKININNYPGSANVYDSLGECYEAMNKLSLARVNYGKAYERGQEIEDPNTGIYKLHLDNLLEKLSGFD